MANRKLINLRNSNRFRFVKADPTRPGPVGINWSSCSSTMDPENFKGGKGGDNLNYGAFQTATGVTYLGWRYQQQGLKLIAQGFGANIMSTGMSLPAFVAGVGLFNYGSTMVAKFTRPCSDSGES